MSDPFAQFEKNKSEGFNPASGPGNEMDGPNDQGRRVLHPGHQQHQQHQSWDEHTAEQVLQLQGTGPVITGVPQGSTGSGTLVGKPQRKFKGIRLVIDSYLGDLSAWALTQVEVASRNQFIGGSQGGGSVPASMFGPLAVGVKMRMDTIGGGLELDITAILTNPTSGAYTDALVGGIVGYAEEERL